MIQIDTLFKSQVQDLQYEFLHIELLKSDSLEKFDSLLCQNRDAYKRRTFEIELLDE